MSMAIKVTSAGKILVTDADDALWKKLDRTQLTTEVADIVPAMGDLLADSVAPINPFTALGIAHRVIYTADDAQYPLREALRCRLLKQVEMKKVTLEPDRIESIGQCNQPTAVSGAPFD
jgi:hypothetical protein